MLINALILKGVLYSISNDPKVDLFRSKYDINYILNKSYFHTQNLTGIIFSLSSDYNQCEEIIC